MDIEKSIDATLQQIAQNLDRTERVLDRTNEVLAQFIAHTDRRLIAVEEENRALKASLAETDARLGQRIDSLVTAVGEFIRRQTPPA